MISVLISLSIVLIAYCLWDLQEQINSLRTHLINTNNTVIESLEQIHELRLQLTAMNAQVLTRWAEENGLPADNKQTLH